MPAFGRLYVQDDRDQGFLMRGVLDAFEDRYFPRGLPQGTRHYRPGPVLDQGNTGTCVAHGWVGWSEGAPLMIKRVAEMDPFLLYDRIVKVDEWDDNDNDVDRQFGTSVRAGAKVLQEEGHIKEYRWAESADDVRSWHLAGFGTVVLGIDWKTGMLETDSKGFLHATGVVEGGHCVKTTGWSDTIAPGGAVRIQNSWNKGWGQKGRAWILRDDLDELIHNQGEACAALEKKIAA